MGGPGPSPAQEHFLGKCAGSALNMRYYLNSSKQLHYECFKLSNNNLKSTFLAAGLTVLHFVMLGENQDFQVASF